MGRVISSRPLFAKHSLSTKVKFSGKSICFRLTQPEKAPHKRTLTVLGSIISLQGAFIKAFAPIVSTGSPSISFGTTIRSVSNPLYPVIRIPLPTSEVDALLLTFSFWCHQFVITSDSIS